MSQNEKKLTFLLLALILFSSLAFKQIRDKNKELDKLINNQIQTEREYREIFGNVSLLAKSAVLYSTKDNHIVFSKAPKKILPLASITKIMTAVVATENSSADSVAIIRKEDITEDGDNGLLVNEKWAQDELVKFMLFNSSNDAASAIAYKVGGEMGGDGNNNREIFVKKMNEKARFLRLHNTFFKNPTGLDVDLSEPGAFGTATDIAKLFHYAVSKNKNLFSPTSLTTHEFISLDGKHHSSSNTNLFISNFPYLRASKTGLTESAGGNLAIVFDTKKFNTEEEDEFIVVVLGSTKDGRFSDSIYLANLTSRYASEEERVSIIVSFLAILELSRQGMVDLMQNNHFEDISIVKSSSSL